MGRVSAVQVGTASVDEVQALWEGVMGWSMTALTPTHWVLRPPHGHGPVLRIKQSDPHTPAVRDGASPTDRCLKNLDIACTDLPDRVQQLAAAGWPARGPHSEYAVDGQRIREVQIAIHDDINLVLLEQLDVNVPCGAGGFGGLTSVVVIVADAEAEQQALVHEAGMTVLARHRLAGAEIEAMIGLPQGGSLDFRLVGDPENLFGRIEIIHYQGAFGTDLHARSAAGHRGLQWLELDGIDHRLVTPGGVECRPLRTTVES